MKPAKVRLAVSAALFVLWMGFLSYLALTSRNPVVLSRPQFLVSTLDVVAQVEAPDNPEVKVEEVHWPPGLRDQLAGQTIRIANLQDCEGFTQPGSYILALTIQGPSYRVVATPRSGLDAGRSIHPRIYPATPESRRQLAEIPKPGG